MVQALAGLLADLLAAARPMAAGTLLRRQATVELACKGRQGQVRLPSQAGLQDRAAASGDALVGDGGPRGGWRPCLSA